ncbi:putative sterigmatocystin biosynthesis P450 monooxygenase STCB [Colletotrichum spaethianum]|uniref:Sterigmatocystin biosynthesis P450 monooxygenase STCB n=1 Tax=Colletotrichum spaethianum TaxID=700344 RepID=A0AA37NWH8_9PEZI|nr:putative sterigmatocystin biosynthesis P450 monooxygenase STCB [Colletotrichum spaethianum]GKT44317.1 putative sterigmatocystin biosynthesis P450 monooxygenase STCB [Colletotrichum spaethianum]
MVFVKTDMVLWVMLTLCILTSIRLLFLGLRNPLKHIPGPWYTLVTHYVLKLKTINGQRMYYVHSLHERYGPIVRISPYQVAVADPDAFIAIHRVGSGFYKSPFYEDFNGTSGFGIGLFAMTDPKRHAARRKLFARSFTKTSLRLHCESVVQEKVMKAVGRIKAEATHASSDILHWWLLMASDVIGQLSFGESFELLEAGKKNDFVATLQLASLGSFISYEFPLLYAVSRYIPIGSVQWLLNAGESILSYGGRAVENLRRHRDNKGNIFATALAECDADEKGYLTDQDIKTEAGNFILAGADTTASTLTYLVWAVLKKPNLQAQVEAEVAAIDEGSILDDVFLEKLPLLNAVIEETLRLYGGVPSNLPRVVPPKGATFGGYHIPGGLEVETQAYTLHRIPDVYSSPLQFDEQRWLDPEKTTPQQKSTFCPFGAGTRICLGVHLARMEMRMAAAALFRHCPGLKLSSSMTDSMMEMENYFIVAPIGHRCDVTLAQ